VDQVAFVVEEDVSVMPVLYLQDIGNYRIGREAANEVLLGFLEIVVEGLQEEIVQTLLPDHALLHAVYR